MILADDLNKTRKDFIQSSYPPTATPSKEKLFFKTLKHLTVFRDRKTLKIIVCSQQVTFPHSGNTSKEKKKKITKSE